MEKVKIGENSRKVWHVLNEMKRISIQELCSRTNLAIEDAMLAIGWLARENSIFIEKRENTIYLSNGSEYHFCFGYEEAASLSPTLPVEEEAKLVL